MGIRLRADSTEAATLRRRTARLRGGLGRDGLCLL